MSYDINGLNANNSNSRARNLGAPKSDEDAQAKTGKLHETGGSHNEGSTDRVNEKASVELSGTGKLLQKLGEKISQQPDVDQEKVDYFKGLIESNTYIEDSKALAENIFKSDNL